MKIVFSGNALWHLVMQSDWITKGVLLFLLGMSVLCWTIFLYKWILSWVKQRHMNKILAHLKEIQTFDELRMAITPFNNTIPGYFIKRNLVTLKSLMDLHPENPRLDDRQMQLVYAELERSLDDLIHHEESYLSILFSCASVSPLLGLFGTIWGLIHSFVKISEKQSADIVTVAPGIAEALITTLAGLIVAIPALMMYHYLINNIKSMEQYYYQLSDKFIWIVQRKFVLGSEQPITIVRTPEVHHGL